MSFENFYLSNEEWKQLQCSVMESRTKLPITRDLRELSGIRINNALKAIKLTQTQLVELASFRALLREHNLRKDRYSRETIARIVNNCGGLSDHDYIKWINVFSSFFFTDRCIFVPRERSYDDPELYNEDSKASKKFIEWFQNYCRGWVSRKNKFEYSDKQKRLIAKQKPNINRTKAIVGRWEGDVKQEFKNSEIIPAKVEAELTLDSEDMIQGELIYRFKVNDKLITATFTVCGEFLYDSFLRLNYINVEDFIKQFGAVVLELDPTGSYLTGKFVGFGAHSKRIIKADGYFKKII